MAFTALIYMQLEQCRMVVCKFIAAVQYMHVLRQLRRGFCTIVLHSIGNDRDNKSDVISHMSCKSLGGRSFLQGYGLKTAD